MRLVLFLIGIFIAHAISSDGILPLNADDLSYTMYFFTGVGIYAIVLDISRDN